MQQHIVQQPVPRKALYFAGFVGLVISILYSKHSDSTVPCEATSFLTGKAGVNEESLINIVSANQNLNKPECKIKILTGNKSESKKLTDSTVPCEATSFLTGKGWVNKQSLFNIVSATENFDKPECNINILTGNKREAKQLTTIAKKLPISLTTPLTIKPWQETLQPGLNISFENEDWQRSFPEPLKNYFKINYLVKLQETFDTISEVELTIEERGVCYAAFRDLLLPWVLWNDGGHFLPGDDERTIQPVFSDRKGVFSDGVLLDFIAASPRAKEIEQIISRLNEKTDHFFNKQVLKNIKNVCKENNISLKEGLYMYFFTLIGSMMLEPYLGVYGTKEVGNLVGDVFPFNSWVDLVDSIKKEEGTYRSFVEAPIFTTTKFTKPKLTDKLLNDMAKLFNPCPKPNQYTDQMRLLDCLVNDIRKINQESICKLPLEKTEVGEAVETSLIINKLIAKKVARDWFNFGIKYNLEEECLNTLSQSRSPLFWDSFESYMNEFINRNK